MASGRLNLAPVTTRLVPFAESLAVYNDLVQPPTATSAWCWSTVTGVGCQVSGKLMSGHP